MLQLAKERTQDSGSQREVEVHKDETGNVTEVSWILPSK